MGKKQRDNYRYYKMTKKAQNISDQSSADEHSQQDAQETQSQTMAEPELRRRSSEEAVDTSQVEVSAEEENCCKDDENSCKADENCCKDDEHCQDGTVCEREDEDCCKNVANCADRKNVDPETPEEDKTSKSSKKKWTKSKKKMMLLSCGLVALSTALILNLSLAFGGEPPEPIAAPITTDTTLQVTTTVPVTTAAITTDSMGGQTTASPTTAAPTTAAPTWFTLAQNNEKTHHAVFDPTWTVSFSLYPTAVSSSLTNIVHLSTGYNDVNYGDKILAVYFLPNTQHLRFDSDINANYGYSYSYNSSDIPLNQWTNVTVSQTYANSTSKYTFAIEIDGTEVHSLENTRAQQFFGVKEYWSDPWADAALAKVDNVTVVTSRDIGSWSDDETWFNTSDREVWWPNVPKLYKRYEITIDAIYIDKVPSQSYMMYVHTVPLFPNCNGWVTVPIQHIKFFGNSHRNVHFFFEGDSALNGFNAAGVQQLKTAQEYHSINNTYDRVLYRDGVEVYKMENYLGSAVHDNVFGYACPPGCQLSASAPICANFLIRNFRIRSFPDLDGATRSFHDFHNEPNYDPNPRATAGATPLLQNYILLIFISVYSILFV